MKNKQFMKITIAFVILFISIVAVKNAQANQVECLNVVGDGDIASHKEGWHQIFNSDLKFGSDDVYSREYGALQCFCDGQNGIQTTWTASQSGKVNGAQWNLGDRQYDPVNTDYYCGLPTPANTPPPATPFPTDPPHISTPAPTFTPFPGEQEVRGPQK